MDHVEIRVTNDRDVILSGGVNATVNATKQILVTLGIAPAQQAPGGQPHDQVNSHVYLCYLIVCIDPFRCTTNILFSKKKVK